MTTLGRYRLAAGYPSARHGAQALGISRVYLSKIECGSALPSAGLVERMAGTYGVAPEEIRVAIKALHRAYLKRGLAA